MQSTEPTRQSFVPSAIAMALGMLFGLAFLALLFFLDPPKSHGADSDRDRRIRVALALAGVPADQSRTDRVSHALTAPCDCDDTGVCRCKPGACGCCTDDVPPLAVQEGKARKEGKPLVAYYGCRGRCADGALVGRGEAPPAGLTGPVVVYAPVPGGLAVVAQLPAGARPEAVQSAIRHARGYIGTPSTWAAPSGSAFPAWPTGGCSGGACSGGSCAGGYCR